MFAWDYCLTMGMEIEYVWPGKWNTLKIIYLVQRYMPFIDTFYLVLWGQFGSSLSPSTCHRINNWVRALTLVGLASSEMILTLRAWAVWNRNKALSIFLPIAFAACWIPQIILTVRFVNSLGFIDAPSPFLGCFIVKANDDIVFNWALFMLWDSLVLILMIIPALKAYHFRGHSALYSTVYAEGIMYYVYLFFLSLANIILIRLKSIDVGYRLVMVTQVHFFGGIVLALNQFNFQDGTLSSLYAH
ncbi:unnamed protein product [Cyclocybe aegerita]|uniref:DUF6533 domain-containing protein n=1 Tax=Cyclocybe aegerita TaxID=1973307 RepID=A0A8S0XR31_CYCAE|nr:unnamed protein product [Cyclocybe aegerita]